MIEQASVTGLLRTLLIIAGIYFLLKLLGRILIAKRNFEKNQALKSQQEAFIKEREAKLRNIGKTTISKNSEPVTNSEFVDFEEVD